MKYNFKAFKIPMLGIAIASVIASCSKESEGIDALASEDIVLTDEIIEKIAYGCNSYLDQELSNGKVETSASDEYMALIEDRMSLVRANKYVEYTYNYDQQYVGVIEVNGCGKYEKYNEVVIFYDSENKNNRNSNEGFRGAWSGSRNITMRFCLVPYQSFGRTGEWYGVMNFSDLDKKSMLASSSQGILHALMDAEDHNDDNTYMRFNNFVAGVGSWPESKIGNVKVDKNGNLNFQMIVFEPGDWSETQHSYPDFGFDYGVFGTLWPNTLDAFTTNNGKVYSDDEDNDNANWIKYNGSSVKNSNFHNIIMMDKNTTMYLSKVESKYKYNM